MTVFGNILVTWLIAILLGYLSIYPETVFAKFLTKIHNDDYDAVLRNFGFVYAVSIAVIILIEVWFGF